MKIDYEQLRVRKLSPAEHIASFDCGDEDLNSFILEEAPAYRKALLAVTYVVEDKFIKSYFVADNKTGCRFLTVDAYADAIPFYLKNGFIPLNEDDAGQATRLLFFDLNDIDETE